MSFGFAFSLPAYSNPIGNGGGILAGASLVLDFTAMDTSYTTGPTLDVSLRSQQYQQWQRPTGAQGAYLIWEGFAPWEPGLDLDFIRQYYQQQI